LPKLSQVIFHLLNSEHRTSCLCTLHWPLYISVMFNEAKTSRPRPKLRGWGRGQSYEAEARTMRSRPRPKIIMKKYQIMI